MLDAYIRVSQVGGRSGESFISPSVQLEQINRWAKANRVKIGRVFEELDLSGGRADRPLFLEALERVESGASQGVIVAKLDRFGRSVRHGLNAIARIEDADGVFVSVNDGFDLRTPTGKFMLRVMLSMAELELDRYRENWEIASERAVARGVHMTRRTPLGYRRTKAGRLKVNPATAPIIAEVFRLRVVGTSNVQIAQFLEDSGLRTMEGHRFDRRSIYTIIHNKAYRGEVHCRPHSNRDAHEAIVDEATWEAAQTPRRAVRGKATALLAGILRCAGCGRLMMPVKPNSKSSPSISYRCPGRGCPAPSWARADELEPLVEEWVLALLRLKRTTISDTELVKREVAARDARSKLEAHTQTRRESLPPGALEAGLAAHEVELRTRLLALSQARISRGQPCLPNPESDWEGLGEVGRRRFVAERLDCVYVERDGPLISRARVSRRGAGPAVPDRFFAAPAFDWPSIRSGTLKLLVPKRWNEDRIEAGLREFFSDRQKAWPPFGEFALAGKGRLHAQAMDWGGPLYWAPKLSVDVPASAVRWNHDRVRGALRPILRGRRKWPGSHVFRAAGQQRLQTAVYRHGGTETWAAEFGLRFSPREKKRWTRLTVEKRLKAFTSGRSDYPAHREFEDAGLQTLYWATTHYGGRDYWAERLGMAVSASRGGR